MPGETLSARVWQVPEPMWPRSDSLTSRSRTMSADGTQTAMTNEAASKRIGVDGRCEPHTAAGEAGTTRQRAHR